MKILTECNLAQLVVDLLAGKTVVFPTETSYGLGCAATNQAAVDKIFKIKGRGSDKPLLVVVPTVEVAKKYLVWNTTLEKVAQKYWPGAVTVVGEYGNPPLSQKRGQGEISPFSLSRVAGFLRTIPLRRELRKNQTKAETVIWNHLKNKRLGGIKFLRQHGVGPYIVDFFQADTKLVIEIDGDVHFAIPEQEAKDKIRQWWLEDRGYKVIRYNNVDVFSNFENILNEILHTVTTAKSHPTLPSAEERGLRLANGVVSKENMVAIRVTADPLLRSITERLGQPLVATSANVADEGDSYSAEAVVTAFQDRADQPDIILNSGDIPRHAPTTIVSVVGGVLKILRQGEQQVTV